MVQGDVLEKTAFKLYLNGGLGSGEMERERMCVWVCGYVARPLWKCCEYLKNLTTLLNSLADTGRTHMHVRTSRHTHSLRLIQILRPTGQSAVHSL